jgi:ABC-type bacteriocin/lantibiotic exporter with double-glycine peptidase domain
MLARHCRSRRNRWPLMPFVAALALCTASMGCSATRLALSPDAIELHVAPVRQQEGNTCGLATVEALTAYHGVQLDAATRERIAEHTSAQDGLTGADLRTVLESAGMEVYLFRGTLDHSATGLWRALDRGLPLVVAIASAPGRNHYVLLVGYDPRTGDVAVLDPAQGRLVIPADRFVACWQGAERFTLLAVPSGAAPTDLDFPTASLTPSENSP